MRLNDEEMAAVNRLAEMGTFKNLVNQCLKKEPSERPTVPDLLKHKFILKAKKTSNLIDLIEKHRKWVEGGGHDSDSSSDEEREEDQDMGALPDWEWPSGGTIKGAPSGSGGDSGGGAAAEDDATRMLKKVIVPALAKIKADQSKESGRTAADLALITELSKAFELAEVSKPGILDDLVREICTTMLSL